jgi:diguanylate cyclase (GGDEF)-like protein
MRIRIQTFSLLLFLSLGLLASGLWSLSLYSQYIVDNVDRAELHRSNWKLQLERLQAEQKNWLQQRYVEVAHWLQQHPEAQRRAQFIARRYDLYPQLRLIRLGQFDASAAPSSEPAQPALEDCSALDATAISRLAIPQPRACRYKQQAVLAIVHRIKLGDESVQLAMLMDYFSFMKNFEHVSGKHLYLKHTSLTQDFVEQDALKRPSVLTIRFEENAVEVGTLTLLPPAQPFFGLWLSQAVWVIPLMLLLSLGAHVLMMTSLINPLRRLSQRMQKAVRSRRPGKIHDSDELQTGLLLLQKYFMHLVHMAKHDPLTGLNNRAIFEERLSQAIVEGKRSGRKYALVLVDINHFYKINRKYGIYLGDGLLKQLARRLSKSLRETDTLARLEKDNFALLLEFVDEEQIASLVEKIYHHLSQPYKVYGREIVCGISIGVAIYPDHAQDMETLELKGNEALLQAHQGDWPVVFTHQDSDQSDYAGLSLIQSLRQALESQDFKLVYQPVVSLKDHSTRYFEALLRWKQPDRHAQSIEKTIQLAEKNQLIKPLSQWIIETACAQLNHIAAHDIRIAVNLSMIDLHDEDLPARIRHSLSECGIEPSRLMVEITEGQIMQEPDQVIEILNQLSAMGISLSIDDFGTGQASLTYLKKLPVEKLKIDQSFVKHMVEDEEDRAIVEATIQLAHTLGIEVVAEGVESAEIHALLMQMGCDFAQGYYISRPLEQETVDDWIADTQLSPSRLKNRV